MQTIPIQSPSAPAPWKRWLIPRSSDWIPAFLYLGVLLDYLIQHHSALFHWQTLLVVGALTTLAVLERWEYWRYGEQAPLHVRQILFVVNLLLIEVVAQISFEGIGSFLYLILPFKAWVAFGRGSGYAVACGVIAVYIAKTLLVATQLPVPIEQLLSGCIMFGTATGFVVTLSQVAASDRLERQRAEQLLELIEHSHRDLEQSHKELAAYAAQVADLATVAERNRMARDIHDSLGHYLTAIAIQLEKALAFHDKDREESQRSVQTSRRLAQEALTDVRRSVGLLRAQHEPFSLGDMLHNLAVSAADGHLKVGIDIAGDEVRYGVASRMVLYRAAQEGLTNIRRHAHAKHVHVDLHFALEQATLRITDDGRGFDPEHYQTAISEQTASFGIQGLRERVALVGGTLDIAPAPTGGTVLTVALPAEPTTTGIRV